MARADRRRAKRTKPSVAAVAKGGGRSARPARSPSIEDTMFFPRLRRHARWMFVFLALVFGLGFVVFGVGAGGTGIGDIFRGGGTSGAPSISDARKRTEKNPKDAEAWRDYSTALQTEGRADEAVLALQQYTELQPRDPQGYRELAGLYLAQANDKQREAQLVQLRAVYETPGLSFPGLMANGQEIVRDQLATAIGAQASQELSTAITAASTAYASAVDTYEQLARLQPQDANVQLELASAAQQANNATVAIAAYERFLQLAPDDPNASIVKQQLEQLRQASG